MFIKGVNLTTPVESTILCVRCGSPATSWCGHVIKRDGFHVIAGWCSDDCRNAPGFYGRFTEDMLISYDMFRDEIIDE